jgi:hypothetical protein
VAVVFPPDVEAETMVDDVDVLMEYIDLILMWAEEAEREVSEEERELMEKIGDYLNQWEEFWFEGYV